MLSREEIESSSDQLTPVVKALWLNMWRGHSLYQEHPFVYSDISSRLDASVGTVKARMLNALLVQLEELGGGEASLVPGTSRGGVQYSQHDERASLIEEGFRVLYDYADMVIAIYGVNRVAVAGTRSTFALCPNCGHAPWSSPCRRCSWIDVWY